MVKGSRTGVQQDLLGFALEIVCLHQDDTGNSCSDGLLLDAETGEAKGPMFG